MPGHRWRSAAAGWLRQAADSLSPRESRSQDPVQDGRYDGGGPGGSAGGGPQRRDSGGAGFGGDSGGAGFGGAGYPGASAGAGRRFDVAGAPEHWVKLLRQAGLVPDAPRKGGPLLPQPGVHGARSAEAGADSPGSPEIPSRDAWVDANPVRMETGTPQGDAVQGDPVQAEALPGQRGLRFREPVARRVPRLIVGRRAPEQPAGPESNHGSGHPTAVPQASGSAVRDSRSVADHPGFSGSAGTGSVPSSASAVPADTAGPAAAGSPAGTIHQRGSNGSQDPPPLLPNAPDPRQASPESPARELPSSDGAPSGPQDPAAREAPAPTPGPISPGSTVSRAAQPPALHPSTRHRQPEPPDQTRPQVPQPPAERTDSYEGRSAVVGPDPTLPVEKMDPPPPRPALAGEWPELPQSQARQAPSMPPERVEHLLTRTLRLRDEQRAV